MTAAPPRPPVAVQREGAVLHLWLDRPHARNAMSLAMVRMLHQALAEAQADGHTRVIVLRGAGGHFCAGADLKDLTTARLTLSRDPQALAAVNRAFGELCVAFAHTGLAVVAVAEGVVMGGGIGLVCAADVALAGQSAQFRLPEVQLGTVPAQIAPFLIDRVGPAEARRLAVTGAVVDAAQALALRLVHEVHAADALDAAVARAVRQILHGAPGAIAATKAYFARARAQPPGALVHEAAEVFSRAVLTDEGTEGTMAFLQKRRARWMPE